MSPDQASPLKTAARFFTLPVTPLGKAALIGFSLAILAIALMATLVELWLPSLSPLIGGIAGVSVLVTAIAGFAAILVQRERSVTVIIPATLCLLITISELSQLIQALLH